MNGREPMAQVVDDMRAILARTRGEWEALRGESLFITGGTGFFGLWLLECVAMVNRELALNLRVKVLSRDPESFLQCHPRFRGLPWLSFHRGDVTNFSFPDEGFSHVIHAATTSARETFHGAEPLDKFDTLVNGTRRVLKYAAASGVRNLLFTSSGVVYGRPGGGEILSESFAGAPDPLDPLSALGQSKRAAEFLCAAYADKYGFNTTIARCFSFVGPFMPLDLHYAIGDFMLRAMQGEDIVVQSDGTASRSYLYAADMVCWLLRLLLRQGAPRAYNVGSDAAVSIAELAALVRQVSGAEVDVIVRGRDVGSMGNPARNYYVPDIGRARSELALDVWTPLTEAITRSYAFFRTEARAKHA